MKKLIFIFTLLLLSSNSSAGERVNFHITKIVNSSQAASYTVSADATGSTPIPYQEIESHPYTKMVTGDNELVPGSFDTGLQLIVKLLHEDKKSDSVLVNIKLSLVELLEMRDYDNGHGYSLQTPDLHKSEKTFTMSLKKGDSPQELFSSGNEKYQISVD